jgi:hypothetical protein
LTEPTLRLTDVHFGPDGELRYPGQRARAGEESLPDLLSAARALLASRSEHIDDGPTGMSDEFEALRWFPLPPVCLDGVDRGDSGR